MTKLKRINPCQSFVLLVDTFFLFAGIFWFSARTEATIFGTAQIINADIKSPKTKNNTVPEVPHTLRAAAAIIGATPKPRLPPTEKIPIPVALLPEEIRLTVRAATG